jgi:hypothetical protein
MIYIYHFLFFLCFFLCFPYPRSFNVDNPCKLLFINEFAVGLISPAIANPFYKFGEVNI